MKIEVKPKNYSENDKNQSFVERCTVIVKTTDDNGNATEKKEKGCILQGEEMVFINAPEIYFPENAPLDTEKRELYEILNELFQDGGEGGDWQPPPWWIPVPEPEPYEILVLVWITSTNNSFGLSLVNKETGYGGEGALSCDWGDGTTTDIPAGVFWGSSVSHKFAKVGQYLIKITTTDELNVMYAFSRTNCFCQIIKTGSNILFFDDYHDEHGYTNTPFSMNYGLKYIKVNNEKGLPVDKTKFYFEENRALQKIELKKPMSGNIPQLCFIDNYALTDFNRTPFDCDSVNSVGVNAFKGCYNLRKIILPNCTSIGDYAFAGCYNLQEIIVAEGCSFGKDCFQGCYSLFPRPDGSTD